MGNRVTLQISVFATSENSPPIMSVYLYLHTHTYIIFTSAHNTQKKDIKRKGKENEGTIHNVTGNQAGFS